VPIIQLALSGKASPSRTSPISASISCARRWSRCGRGIPYPFGGKHPQVQIDLDTAALQARGLTGQDVANALAAQNLITPVGTEKIGDFEYTIKLNNAPSKIEELGDLPIKTVNGAMVYMRDVATCATAIRRRPTSCTSTATARC
jgi:multidrug efflux pump subunit AcrB